jgi:hypothetical protein
VNGKHILGHPCLSVVFVLSISLVFDDVPTIRLNDIEIRWMSAGVLLLQMIDIMISV